jgi:hypothetical protein
MGIWIAGPALAGSEAVTWQHLASRAQSERRDVGGRLYLTTTRLLFEPSRLDALTGGRRWTAPLDSIRSVSVKSWREVVFNRSKRDLLRLDLADGSLELFWILGLDDAVRVIQGAITWPTEDGQSGS